MASEGVSARLGSQPLVLDPAGVSAWLGASLDALGAARSAIDSLNVFPIADGDTGTNMYLTLESCWEAAQAFGQRVGSDRVGLDEVTQAVATAALLGARGNSGIIMAEALRGICDTIARDETVLSVPLIARALRAASDRARAAVAHPVEGTILTVAEATAAAAEAEAAEAREQGDSDSGSELMRRLLRISERMHAALAATTDQLDVLADAGVVDAGAQGLVIVYDALLDAITGVHRRREPVAGRVPARAGERSAGTQGVESDSFTGDFEVMFTCTADPATIDRVRAILDALGDSLVVSGGPELWSVHVHVDDAGSTIEAIYEHVRASNLRVTHLPSQASAASSGEAKYLRAPGRSVVAQAHGRGIRDLLAAEGVVVIEGRPDRRPSTMEILTAIESTDREEIIVLPSDGDTIPVAEVAADQARARGIRVSVIPTRSVVQTLAAWAVHDAEARFDDAVVAMADASRATRYGAITIASKDALTMAGRCQIGDVLGLVEGDIVEIGIDPSEVTLAVLQRLMSTGGELVTAIPGEDADPGLVERLRSVVGREFPGVDLDVIDGGQPLWPLILGVE